MQISKDCAGFLEVWETAASSLEPGDGKEALELSYVTCIFGLKLFMFLLPREIYPSAWLQYAAFPPKKYSCF